MSEIYLHENDEEKLKQQALNRIAVALLADYAQNSLNPAETLLRVERAALELAANGIHSSDEETNVYAKKFVAGVINEYFAQFSIKQEM